MTIRELKQYLTKEIKHCKERMKCIQNVNPCNFGGYVDYLIKYQIYGEILDYIDKN